MKFDITQFCAADNGRKSLGFPWQENVTIKGYCDRESRLVACDGSVAVMVDIESKTPNVSGVFGKFNTVAEWLPFPEMKSCEKCRNSGQVETPCETCGGSGRHDCECGSEHDCGKCDGNGDVLEDCESCQVVLERGRGGDRFRIKGYDSRRINDLPAVKYGFPENEDGAVFLMFHGGIGKVMATKIDE